MEYSKKTRRGNVNVKIEDRKKAKTEMYSGILFAFSNCNGFTQNFKELYPETYSFLKQEHQRLNDQYMENNGKTPKLAGMLQKVESDIFQSVKVNSPYFTVHDSIYFTDREEKHSILNQLETAFKKYKVVASLHVENE
jgi:hypothetical protein